MPHSHISIRPILTYSYGSFIHFHINIHEWAAFTCMGTRVSYSSWLIRNASSSIIIYIINTRNMVHYVYLLCILCVLTMDVYLLCILCIINTHNIHNRYEPQVSQSWCVRTVLAHEWVMGHMNESEGCNIWMGHGAIIWDEREMQAWLSYLRF